MNTIKKIVIICVLCVFALSCKESFLDLAPVSNTNANNFFKTRQDFDLAVNAAYASLYISYGPESGVSYAGEQMSDDCYIDHAAGAVDDKRAFKDYVLFPSNSINYLFWQQYYNSLYNINVVLDKIEGTDLDAAYIDQVKSEMMFLRALNYFIMVQMWGDLPIVTRPLTAKESYDIVRSPASEVYNLIISDLQFSIARLPLQSAVSAPGKVSKGAAQTLLAKVYMATGNKTAALPLLNEVYSSAQYSLVLSYADLWSITKKNSKESIFEIQYKGGAGNPYSVYYPIFAPFENFSITSLSGGMNLVTDDLYNEYEPGDPRRDISIDTGYTKISKTDTTFVKVKFPKKWVDKTVAYGKEFCDNNFIVLRYADLLLLLSEATGDASYLNQVRARVGLPGFGEAGYPSQYSTIELAVEHERRVELALEFHRWFDLKRTGRATTILTAKKGKTITDAMLLLPIPERVIQQNDKIKQNSAYIK